MNDPKLNAALHPLEVHADGEAAGNDRSVWPYVEEATEARVEASALPVVEPSNPHYINGRCVLDSCAGPHLNDAAQPVVEADEREALANLIPLGFTERDGVRDAFEAADRILAAGFRRSQPAPRTVTEWGWRDHFGTWRAHAEQNARDHVAASPERTLVRREITEWTEVSR